MWLAQKGIYCSMRFKKMTFQLFPSLVVEGGGVERLDEKEKVG